MSELDEFCLKAYENSDLYKEKMKKFHDQKIQKYDFMVGDLVFLFNSRLRPFPDKLVQMDWSILDQTTIPSRIG